MLKNKAIQTTIYVVQHKHAFYVICYIHVLPSIWKLYHTFHIKVIHYNIQKFKLESKHTDSYHLQSML
jgi:hypothetical protein